MLFTSCANSSGLFSILGGQAFWARDFRSGQGEPYPIQALFRGSSQRANLFVEVSSDVELPSRASSRDILDKFDSAVFETEADWFTTPIDIDGNDKVNIVLMDIKDGGEAAGAYIAGYFDPYNQYPDDVTRDQFGLRSNEAEIVYLDIRNFKAGGEEFFATLAHEYQHLLQFSRASRRASGHDSLVFKDTWITEGLAEVSSDLAGFTEPQLQRVETFELDWPLTAWTGDARDYSLAYMFFRWLTDVFGKPVLTEIFKSDATGPSGIGAAIKAQAAAENFSQNPYNGLSDQAAFQLSYFYWLRAFFPTTNRELAYMVSSPEAELPCLTGCGLNTNEYFFDNDRQLPAVYLEDFGLAGGPFYGQDLRPYTVLARAQYDSDPPTFGPACTSADTDREYCAALYTNDSLNDSEGAYLLAFHTFDESNRLNILNGRETARPIGETADSNHREEHRSTPRFLPPDRHCPGIAPPPLPLPEEYSE